MREWSTALPDWESRIAEGRSLIPCEPLFQDEADAALAVFRDLRVADIAGCPTMGEICRPWIIDFVAAVFGSYDAEAGRRLITEYLLCVSKKNFKSGLAAGIMMTALIKNWRESAEFSIIAPTIEIANNSFVPARDMVRRDDELADLMHVQEHYRTITNQQTGASLKVIAADTETVSGKKSSGVLVDELWQFGKRPSAESMLLEATGGLASRPEGFIIYLTTHSDEAPAGVFDKKLKYARGVRDGRIDDKRFMPVLFEFPKRMLEERSYLEPKNWALTNPNLGASVDEEFIAHKLREAQEAGQDSLIKFCAKHFNVEIGVGLGSNNWAGAEFWDRQGDQTLTLAALLERCEVVVVGIDGGGLDDLLGLCVLGRERDTRRWLAWHHAWAHKIVLERRKEIAPRLLDFAAAHDLTIVESPGQDVADVADIVCQIRDRGLLPDKNAVGVDAAGIGEIVNELTAPERGITAEQIVGVQQGWRLSASIKSTERRLAGGELLHGARPMMAWIVGNAKAEIKANNVHITKQASGTAKIDPLMATFDAGTLMGLNPEAAADPTDFLQNPIIA